MTLEHKICAVDDIDEGRSRGFEVAGQAIFLVKSNGALHCYANACPHLGVELEWDEDEFLDPGGKLIRCNMHGALFTIEDGVCIAGPCHGDQLAAMPIRIRDEAVYLLSEPNRRTSD